jgi:hypothetical protein
VVDCENGRTVVTGVETATADAAMPLRKYGAQVVRNAEYVC